MSKRPLAVMLGITGDMAFAAGCVLRGLKKYSPGLDADILLYTDGTVPEADAAILRDLGAALLPFTPLQADFDPHFLKILSPLCLAKFEALRLLDRYARIVWLDVDIAVQGDIAGLIDYGPLGMACEDPAVVGAETSLTASLNSSRPVPGLDPDQPNRNSGVVVFHDSLPNPEKLYRMCMRWLAEHAPHLKYMDQPALNMLYQMLARKDPALVAEIPYAQYNAHPFAPGAQHAALVHAFGVVKMWNEGLMRCAFPEWSRDYAWWVAGGGSPWKGAVRNAALADRGALYLLYQLRSRSALGD